MLGPPSGTTVPGPACACICDFCDFVRTQVPSKKCSAVYLHEYCAQIWASMEGISLTDMFDEESRRWLLAQ